MHQAIINLIVRAETVGQLLECEATINAAVELGAITKEAAENLRAKLEANKSWRKV